MSSIIKGITDEQSVTKKEPEVQVPGYGTMPLDMLKRHVQSLSKEFNDSIQKGEFLKAAYRTEQFYNALMALAKAMKQQSKVDETHSTGTTVGSAGIGGGVGLGIDKSPIEKVLEKPFSVDEGKLPPKAGFNKKPHKVGPGTSKDDYEYKSYIPRDRKEKGEEWAIARDVRNVNSKLGKKKPKELDTGFYKSYLSNRPVREGEVVSLEARRSPLVIAGSPYDWDIYDLRTNKMVANILGGDRHESPLYEIRINRNGMTKRTRMKPTYVLRAGKDNNPPYKAYELVDTPERYGKIEKSPGPGGTTKLHPDEDDMLRHMFKVMGGGKYYGYDLELVEEGLDQYQIIEKALGAKIMEIDDAMELGYTDVDPEDSSSIVYLGNQKNEGYSAGASGGAGLGEEVDEGIKSSIAAGILSGMGLLGSAQGQSADLSNFSTSYLQQVVSGEHPRPMVNKDDAKIELQKREQGASTPSQPSAPKSTSGGFSNEYLKSVVDGTHPRPMVSVEKAKEILQQRGVQEHINTPGGMGQSYRKFKPKAAGINELKCWSGYTRVKGVPAGAPGSCKKKTKESSIMKGIQSEEQVDEYKEVPGQRKIEFSKENPPDLYYLYQQFIQRMLNPENTIDPKDWIEKVNNHYGLNYNWKDYQKRGHNDHTDNWQKIINKYILKKS